jgi:tetratricopeptide (TPR) repeat protein
MIILLKQLMTNSIKKTSGRNKILIFLVGPLVTGFIILVVFFTPLSLEKRSLALLYKPIDSLISWRNEAYLLKQSDAFAIIELSKSMAIETADPEIIGNVLNKEASFLKQINHYAKAILSYKQAVNLYTKSGRLDKLAGAYFDLADIYKIIGEYSKSLEFCARSLELYEKLKDNSGIKRCYRIMGSDYKYIKAYDKALVYYEKSLAISREEGVPADIAVALNNLGTAYEAMGNDSAAFKCYSQCYDFYRQGNNMNGLSIYHNNIGSIFLHAKQYEQAIENFRLALRYRKLTTDKRRAAIILDNIGSYFYVTNQYDSSIFYYKQSLKIASELGIKETMASGYLALSMNYIKKKMPYDAYQELLEFNHLKDTVQDAQKSIEIAKIEESFQAYKEQLESDNEKEKHRLFYVIYVLSILLFSLGFLLLLKWYRKSVQKHEKFHTDLVEEKSKIELDLSDKNKELITYSLQIAQKQEIDLALAERIRIEIHNSSGETKVKLQSILANIIQESQRINIWEDFEIRFNQVNQNFYKNLIEKFPSLTQNEKRLCAFTKLNLTTKEITIITGQSPHSINVARTRLRKKIGISNSSQNIFDFFQQF